MRKLAAEGTLLARYMPVFTLEYTVIGRMHDGRPVVQLREPRTNALIMMAASFDAPTVVLHLSSVIHDPTQLAVCQCAFREVKSRSRVVIEVLRIPRTWRRPERRWRIRHTQITVHEGGIDYYVCRGDYLRSPNRYPVMWVIERERRYPLGTE